MGTDVVTLPAMANDSVDKSNIKTSAVGTDEILDGEIVNADISASAGIVDTKLAQITTASKVSGAALTSLSSIPAGAGLIPAANIPAVGKFGGTGADGALSITSGVTTLDLAGVAVFEKNYTSISITGTGSLAFINPHANGTIITLKSQGAVTLTSSTAPMISVAGLGATGGNGGAAGSNPVSNCFSPTDMHGQITTAGTGKPLLVVTNFSNGFIPLVVGAGAGGGQNGSGANGAGGRGGGGLIIHCAGSWNFTTASGLSANGNNGSSGSASGGGGGGGGGFVLAIYNSLTSNTGTITVAGGTGAAGTGSWNSGGGGASQKTSGTNGAIDLGGNGGAGWSLVTANNVFA